MDLRILKVVTVVVSVTLVMATAVLNYMVFEDEYSAFSPTMALAHFAMAGCTVLGVFAFAAAMFYFVRRAERQNMYCNRQMAIATATERSHIAREMHDVDAQVLAAIHVRLRALAAHVPMGSPIASEVEDIANICGDAYRDVREALLGLRAASRNDGSFLEGLKAYLDKYSRQFGIAASLETSLDGEPQMSPHCEIQIIRVIQEALSNVRKHSRAQSAMVRVTATNDEVTFVVSDNAQGFDLRQDHFDRDRYGISTMRERMALIGGTLAIETRPGAGTRVIAKAPLRDIVPTRVPVPVGAGSLRGDDRAVG